MFKFIKRIYNKFFVRTLDASSHRDSRNKNYPLSLVLEDEDLKSRRWKCKARLNQGAEGACVAFGLSHGMLAEPFYYKGLTNKTAFALYERIKRNDRLPGHAYNGTFVEDGLKLLKKDGKISAFHWAMSGLDALRGLSQKGPLVCKIPVYKGMQRAAWNGQIKPTGKRMGFHCILADEIDVERERIWFLNSWGRLYGVDGRVWMSFEDVGFLLENGGIAAAMTKV